MTAGVQAVVDIDGLADFTGAALLEKEAKNPGAPTRFLGGSFARRGRTCGGWHRQSPTPARAARPRCSSTARRPAARHGQGAPILPGRAEMRDRLRAAGVASDLVVIPDTPHPFWLVNPWFDVVVDKTASVLQRST